MDGTDWIVDMVKTSTEEQGQNSKLDKDITTYDLVLSQIKTQMAKFMASLESEDGLNRSSLVVELLSSVSLDIEGQSFLRGFAPCN
jgi:hypothetical protein